MSLKIVKNHSQNREIGCSEARERAFVRNAVGRQLAEAVDAALLHDARQLVAYYRVAQLNWDTEINYSHSRTRLASVLKISPAYLGVV